MYKIKCLFPQAEYQMETLNIKTFPFAKNHRFIYSIVADTVVVLKESNPYIRTILTKEHELNNINKQLKQLINLRTDAKKQIITTLKPFLVDTTNTRKLLTFKYNREPITVTAKLYIANKKYVLIVKDTLTRKRTKHEYNIADIASIEILIFKYLFEIPNEIPNDLEESDRTSTGK